MLASCAKDPLAVLDDQTAPSGSIQLRTDTIVSSRWDSALIQHFYDDILAIQARTPFYDAFYRQYGYFNWAGFKAFRDTEGGKVLTAPVRKDPCGLTTGQFFYYDSGSAERRIKFYSRAELETKIDQAVTLNDEEVLAYQTMALNDLRRTCGDELALNTARLDLMWADVGEPSSSFETCEGGTWENVCIYLQPDEEFEAGWLILQFHNRHFPGIPDRRYYDNMSFGELQNYWNNLNPEGNYNDLLTMQNLRDYYEAREELSLMGIGNGSMGMLVGYRAARLVRHCAFVYVPCWVDLVDYDLNVHTNISGGGPGQNPPPNSSDPPWQSQYNGLRICEGVDDIFEIGPHNLPPVHPPHCRDWLEYLQECALPNSGGIGTPENTYETTVMEWARLRYLNPEWFDALIVDEDNCSYAQHMGCIRAIMEFEQAYPSLNLNNRMRYGLLAAQGGECGSQTALDDQICQALLRFEVERIRDDIFFLCTDQEADDIFDNVLGIVCPLSIGEDPIEAFYKELGEQTDYIILEKSFNSNAKMMCVWNRFRSLENNPCDFLNNFEGETPLDLKFSIHSAGVYPNNAVTKDPNQGDLVEIRFDAGYINETCEIKLMTTLIHEIIHAEIFRFINTLTFDSDFPSTYEIFRGAQNWQHNIMSEWYRMKIKNALRNIYGDSYSEAQYNALSWGGLDEIEHIALDGTISYYPITQAWEDLPLSQKLSIRNLQNELDANCHESCDN